MENIRKNLLRKKLIEQRKNMSDDSVFSLSKIISNKFFKLDIVNSYDSFFVYNSFSNEIQTNEIIETLFSLGKNVFLPKIIGDKMFAVKFSNQTQFTLNKFGIYEPAGQTEEIENFVCIMPCLAVDKNGNRLGFGGGYYDKFLSKNNCLKIVLCYDFQICENLPKENFDIPVDIILSETNFIKTKNSEKLL